MQKKEIFIQHPNGIEEISLDIIQQDINKMLPWCNGYGINLYYIQAMINKITEQEKIIETLNNSEHDNT